MRDRATWTTDVLVHSCTTMRTSKSVNSVGDYERSGASHSSAQRAHGRATRARDDFEYRYYDIQNDPIERAAFDAADISVTPIRRSKRVETGRVAAIVTDSRAFCRPHDDDMRAKKRCENPHAPIARIVASTRDVDIRRWMHPRAFAFASTPRRANSQPWNASRRACPTGSSFVDACAIGFDPVRVVWKRTDARRRGRARRGRVRGKDIRLRIARHARTGARHD